MLSPDQIEKDRSHLFFSLIELDPEDEEESIFMSVLSNIASKHGINAIDIFLTKIFASPV